MNPYVFPAIGVIAGFSIAWIVKPDAQPSKTVTTVEQAAPSRARQESGNRTSAADEKKPKEVRAGDFPLADQVEQGPKTRDEARMLRLSEALGLAVDQQGSIIRLIEDAQAKGDDNIPALQDLAQRGKMVEEGLAQILTPEQLAKFEEIRERERENRVEQRAQRVLVSAIEDIDLSPEQRDLVLSRLRQKSRADMQSIPAVATLLLDKSMLPTNNKELSVDGVLTMAKMGETPDMQDPMAAHKKVMDDQKRELEDLLVCFDGVLTPAQMGQYQAGINETKAVMRKMQTPKERPDPEPEDDEGEPEAPLSPGE